MLDTTVEIGDATSLTPAYTPTESPQGEGLPRPFVRWWQTSPVPAPSLAQQAIDRLHYPESDGKPIAENTLQFDWIELVKGGLEAMFADVPDVFIAADLLWYPDKNNPRVQAAPDVMVAFGRPKGRRGSYLQWNEANIAPQVVWEILSPSNTEEEMQAKQAFYERYGVLEYYEYNPDNYSMRAFTRPNTQVPFTPVLRITGFISPILGIQFDREPTGELVLFDRQGRRLVSFVEAIRQRREAEQEANRQRERAERFAERLRALGIDPNKDEP